MSRTPPELRARPDGARAPAGRARPPRRARPGARRARLLLSVLVLVALTLVVVDTRTGAGSPFDVLRTGAATVASPLQRLAGAAVAPVGDLAQRIGDLGRDGAEARRLAAENETLEARVRELEGSAARGRELDALLGLTAAGRYRTVPARVIGLSGGVGGEATALLDAGSRDGVRAGQTVLSGSGLVGRVVRVTPLTATVLLATDPTSRVGVRVEGSGAIGYVAGAGRGPLRLQMLEDAAAPAPGARLVTLGAVGEGAGSYVTEVPVGEVTTVDAGPGAGTGTVRLYTDLTALGLVGVVVDADRDLPRDSVLPPRPTTAVVAPPAPAPAAATPLPTGGAAPGPTP